MKIRTKIFLIFFISSVVLIIGGIYIQYSNSAKNLSQVIFSHLETAAQSRANHIEGFLQQQENELKLISTEWVFIDFLKSNKNSENYELAFYQAQKRIEELNTGIAIFDLTGNLLIADENYRGVNYDKKRDYFLSSSKDTFFFVYYDIEDRQSMSILSHLNDPVTGNVLGVFEMDIKIEDLYKITLDRTGLGSTGELYLVNRQGYLITPSRFLEDTFLDKKIETQGLEYCFQDNNNGQIEYNRDAKYKNYMDADVFGAYVFIPEIQWCLLAEVSEGEALSIIRKIYVVGIVIGLVIIIFVLIISGWTGRSISRPIEALRYGTEIIEKGDLNHKVGTNSKDEIGQLSRAFDKMTVAIKKSRAGVDKKVKEQTKDINAKKDKLEKQKKMILRAYENADSEREKIKAILYSIGDGVFVIDTKFKITLFNQIAAEITGYSVKDVIGKKYDTVLKFIYEKDKKTNDKFIINAISKGSIQKLEGQTLLITKNKKEIPVADSAAPIKDKQGKVIGCVVVFRDVTKEKEIDRAKSEFVSLASHQLRTPLSAINWAIEMLSGGDLGKLKPIQNKYLDRIYFQTTRMVELVNALLDISRIELGTLILAPKLVDLCDVVDNVLEEFNPLIKEKKLKFIKKYDSKGLKLYVDPKLVRAVFQNLLSNAIKYTPPQGKIKFSMVKKKPNILIKISDTGYGIPKRQQSKIFNKLFRADNIAEKDTEGSGLGLYIVKSIVKQSGGRIWFESEVNKGSTFYVSFPIKKIKI